MKRTAIILICLLMLLSVTVSAKNYSLKDIGISLELDENVWTVFTRDNLRNNPDLERFGLTYEYMMNDVFIAQSVYLNAFYFYTDSDYIELFVLAEDAYGEKDYSEASRIFLIEIVDEFPKTAESHGNEHLDGYTYTSDNGNVFAVQEFFDNTYNCYVCHFVTVVDGIRYWIRFQSSSEFADFEYNEIADIIESTEFEKAPNILLILIIVFAVAAVTVIAVAVIVLLAVLRKKPHNTGYDIFISYRREGGYDLAGRLADRFAHMGYKVFFDVDSMHSGAFNKQIFDALGSCRDVLLILPPNALDRCVNESDWVRIELSYALRSQKNIIPVIMKDFEFPESLPYEIDRIRYIEGVKASNEYFDAVVQRIESMMRCKKKH